MGPTIVVKVHIHNLAILVENVLQVLATYIPRQIANVDLAGVAGVIPATLVGHDGTSAVNKQLFSFLECSASFIKKTRLVKKGRRAPLLHDGC